MERTIYIPWRRIVTRILLFTSFGLIEELADVLPRAKFAKRLAEKQLSIPAIIEQQYTNNASSG